MKPEQNKFEIPPLSPDASSRSALVSEYLTEMKQREPIRVAQNVGFKVHFNTELDFQGLTIYGGAGGISGSVLVTPDRVKITNLNGTTSFGERPQDPRKLEAEKLQQERNDLEQRKAELKEHRAELKQHLKESVPLNIKEKAAVSSEISELKQEALELKNAAGELRQEAQELKP